MLSITETVIIAAAVALFPFILWYQMKTAGNNRKAHSPDSTLPLLGNTLDVAVHGIRGDLHDFTLQLGKQFSAKPVLIRVLDMPPNLVLFTPEAFEDVLKTQFPNFEKGSFVCETLSDLLGDGIFAVDGEQWTNQRKTVSNLFTTRALRDSMTVVIQRHAVMLYGILERAKDEHTTVDLFKLLNRFTIEAFAEIGFGVHMGCLRSDEEHPFQKAFDRAQRTLLLRFLKPRWLWKTQRWLGIGAEGQLQRDIQVIDTTVYEIMRKALAQRLERLSHGSGGQDGISSGEVDIISLFLDNVSTSSDHKEHFDPKCLRDIIVNFVIAGRDTTAQTLSWFFFNLAKNPDVEIAIRKEIMDKLPRVGGNNGQENVSLTMLDVSQLVYLEAALKETLRLHPPVPVTLRQSMEDTTLSDGTFVSAGMVVGLATYSMARMPQVWGPDAEEFKPERWIDSTTGKLRTISAFKFASFNAGPRMCLGMNLAMLEMKVVVTGLLTKFHIEVLHPEDVTYSLSLTLPVKGALNVKVSQPLSAST